KAIAMGSASNGPLLICSEENGTGGQGRFDFFDIWSLNPLVMPRQGSMTPVSTRDGCRVRASANGKVFAVWAKGANRPGIRTLTYWGGAVSVSKDLDACPYAAPGSDGRSISTDRGQYPPALILPEPPRDGGPLLLPACHGNSYLSIEVSRRDGRPEK